MHKVRNIRWYYKKKLKELFAKPVEMPEESGATFDQAVEFICEVYFSSVSRDGFLFFFVLSYIIIIFCFYFLLTSGI